MVFLSLLIILVSYALGCIHTPSLVCPLLFGKKDPQTVGSLSGYPQVHRGYGWVGVGAVFAADLIRGLIVILVGGLLLKGAGFPGVGRRVALLFAVLGQTLPLNNGMKARQGLVFPALMLLWLDWRLFLIALVVFLAVYLPTKRISVCALATAVSYPLFSIILGAWWLQVLLALFAAVALVLPYRVSLVRFFTGLKKGRGSKEEAEETAE